MKRITTLIITVIAAVITLLPAYQVFGKTESTEQTEQEVSEIKKGIYSDGVYTGTGRGFRPGLQVEVEIKNGIIENIKVVKHREVGRQYWQRAVKQIPESIVDQQNTDVDVIGGATRTSRGIISAVTNALSKAEKQK